MGGTTWKINPRTSVSSAPGEVLRKGIHGFIAQSFMVDQGADDASTEAPAEPMEPGTSVLPSEDAHDCLPGAAKAERPSHEAAGEDPSRTQAHLSSPEAARAHRLFSIAGRREELNIGEWYFNALEVEETHGSVSQVVGFELLHKYTSLKRDQLIEFLFQLERGYVKDNPYHTHVHAADVCNAIFFMVNACGLWTSPHFQDHKRISVILAALGHDLGHFGRNSHFLIATRHHLATTYNDRSVLENFHTASLFRIMDKDRVGETSSGDGVRLLGDFGSELYSKTRQLIVALILATDTQTHLEALAEFRMRLNAMESAQSATVDIDKGDASPPGFDPLANAKDQQEALAIMFRAADIGHSAKLWSMHEAWSIRVSEEFHAQGDEERRLGVPISPLCDRRGFVLPTSQMGFLQFVCIPTWTAIARFEGLLKVALRTDDALEGEDRRVSAAVGHGDKVQKGNSVQTPQSSVMSKGTTRGSTTAKDEAPAPSRMRSIASSCLAQCEANLQEWKRQAEALKAEKEKENQKKGAIVA